MAFEGEDAQRWVVTNAPAFQPAEDFITRSPNGPFIDTGFDVTFEKRGRVYLSVETIREMAVVAGILENKNAQEKNLHDEGNYNRGYEAGLKEGADLLAKLSAVTGRLSATDYSSVLHNVEIDENDEGTAGDESGIADDNSDDVQAAPVGKRKSGGKAVSASSLGGRDNVSSVSGNDDSFKL